MTDWVFETRDLKAVPNCRARGMGLTQDEKDAAEIWKNIKYGKNIDYCRKDLFNLLASNPFFGLISTRLTPDYLNVNPISNTRSVLM